MNLELGVLLNLGGMLVGTTALIMGIRGKLEAMKASIEGELHRINETLREAVSQLGDHESSIRDLEWHTGLKGTNGLHRGRLNKKEEGS